MLYESVKSHAENIDYCWVLLQRHFMAYHDESIRRDVDSLVETYHAVKANQGGHVSMQVC
jgi:hypothetical protein